MLLIINLLAAFSRQFEEAMNHRLLKLSARKQGQKKYWGVGGVPLQWAVNSGQWTVTASESWYCSWDDCAPKAGNYLQKDGGKDGIIFPRQVSS
jgi:hypothetical protein